MEKPILDASDRDVSNFRFMLNHLWVLVQDGIQESTKDYVLRVLNEVIDFHSFLIHKAQFPVLHRLTINKKIVGFNKRIVDIGQLKYPPSKLVKSYGRCNSPGQSVLYASNGMLMILSEMRPERGDLITISTWENTYNSELTFAPIFMNQPPDGTFNETSYNYSKQFDSLVKGFPPNIQLKAKMLAQFIADVFSMRFRHNSNDVNYVVSAYFSDIILNKYYDGAVDAIFYPSVQQNLAFENLAIKPEIFDASYKLASVKEAVIVKTPSDGDGGYFQEGISECKNFDFITNTILWPSTYRQSNEVIQNYREIGYEF